MIHRFEKKKAFCLLKKVKLEKEERSIMSKEDFGDVVDEKINDLPLKIFSLPIFRDYGIYFIALLKFDMFLGPVLYYKEIMPGSSYLGNLLNIQQLAEVYAGLANNNIRTLTISEREKVVVGRIHDDEDMESSILLLVGTLSTENTTLLEESVQTALRLAEGAPDKIGEALKKEITRKQEEASKQLKSKKLGKTFKILSEDRPFKNLNMTNIKGALIVDKENHYIDFRFIPQFLQQNKIVPKDFLEELTETLIVIKPRKLVSVYIENVHFVSATLDSTFYLFLSLPSPNPMFASSIGEWIFPFISALKIHWKNASREEIFTAFQYLDKAGSRRPPEHFIFAITQIALMSDRLKPTANQENQQAFQIEPPPNIGKKQWEQLQTLDGSLTISELANLWLVSKLETIFILQWAVSRNLISYLSDKNQQMQVFSNYNKFK